MVRQGEVFRLDGRGMLVTGAARGIGYAVAVAAADAGATIFAVDRFEEGLAQLRAQLGEGHFYEGYDLRNVGGLPDLCSSAERQLPSLDAVAHVAGIILRRESLDDVTEDDFDEQVAVNLKSTFFLNREAARVMRRADRAGSIINFSSQGWWTGGFGGSTVYSATKGGVVSLTRGLARTFATDGIRVNAIAPGAVDTTMMSEGLDEADLARFIDQIPLARMAEPAEVANVVVFLASDASSYLTGTTINVSGGQLIY